MLPGDSDDDRAARQTARTLVLNSAVAAWDNRQSVDGLPLFAAFWDRTAELPKSDGQDAKSVDGAVLSSAIPERDLSVQLAGWMLMEAANAVTAG
jgi:predicted alpha-1,6-mannanase (GH76 family)